MGASKNGHAYKAAKGGALLGAFKEGAKVMSGAERWKVFRFVYSGIDINGTDSNRTIYFPAIAGEGEIDWGDGTKRALSPNDTISPTIVYGRTYGKITLGGIREMVVTVRYKRLVKQAQWGYDSGGKLSAVLDPCPRYSNWGLAEILGAKVGSSHPKNFILPSCFFKYYSLAALPQGGSWFSSSNFEVAGLGAGCLDPLASRMSSAHFTRMFYNNAYIKTLPAGLFSKISSEKITSLASAFGYAPFTALPAGLFSPFRHVTDWQSAFNQMNKIVSLPEGLGLSRPEQSAEAPINMTGMFQANRTLASAPDDLFSGFAGHTGKAAMNDLFSSCNKLGNIPSSLFECLTPSDLSYAFYGCSSLTGESPTFRGMKLWEAFPSVPHGYCFRNCTGLSDYSSIPSDWK